MQAHIVLPYHFNHHVPHQGYRNMGWRLIETFGIQP